MGWYFSPNILVALTDTVTVTVLSCMHSANLKTTNAGQPGEGVNLSRQLSVLRMQSYCALPFNQLFVTALSSCWCCAGAEASSGGLARLGIPKEVVKGSRQHLANSLWAMPILELVTSGHLHATVAKAMEGKS